MKSKCKKLLTTLIGIIFTLALVGCGNKVVKEALQKADKAMDNKEYDKVLVLLEVALDEDKNNEEANDQYLVVEGYLNAKKLVEEFNFEEAESVISEIGDKYTKYPIKEDIDLLKVQIEEKMAEAKAVEEKITIIKYLVEEKKYEEAKTLIEEITEALILQSHKDVVKELQGRIDVELAELEAAKKAEEERLAEEARIAEEERLENEKRKAEEASKNLVSAQQAVEIVKNYLINEGSRVPGIVEVDSEDDQEYTVHAYTDMGTHTATTGWYYVNKVTGEVRSMF